MPLTNPPRVLLQGAWRDTEWDTTTTAAAVENGDRSMGPRDVVWWRWVVQFNRDLPRIVRLRLAGPDAPPASVDGALQLPVGRHPIVALVEQDGQRREIPAGVVSVRAT
jgi:hypothetical protein